MNFWRSMLNPPQPVKGCLSAYPARAVAFGALWRWFLSLVADAAVASDERLSPPSPNYGVVGSGHVSSLGDADSSRKSSACFGRTRPSAGGLYVQRPA